MHDLNSEVAGLENATGGGHPAKQWIAKIGKTINAKLVIPVQMKKKIEKKIENKNWKK